MTIFRKTRSLYKYLLDIGYTENEAEETVLRFINDMKLPLNIRKDIQKYYDDRLYYID